MGFAGFARQAIVRTSSFALPVCVCVERGRLYFLFKPTQNMLESVKHGGGVIMVWAAFQLQDFHNFLYVKDPVFFFLALTLF